jgi:peptidyl-prolyl cis-trans isomerase D
MSILERLRKRSGLLVSIVGIALFAFVLTGLFERGSSIFGGSDREVGEIAGKSIDYQKFNAKVVEAEETQKRNSGKTTLTQEEIDQVVQQTWNQTVNAEVLDPEYEKLGIAVSDEELYDLMVNNPHPALVRNLTDPQSGKVTEIFADPATGQVSPAKLKDFTTKMSDEQEQQWAQLENYVRQVRTIEKYNNAIKKGLYVTKAEAKLNYLTQNTNSNLKVVAKPYKEIADSTVKVEDKEIEAYYSMHKNEYKQEASRKIEYVAFDIAPSAEDIDLATKGMERVAAEFKTKTATEDSAFVIAESDVRQVDKTFNLKSNISPELQNSLFDAEVGTVYGPYNENGVVKATKLTATKNSADSAHVRHILVAYKGAERAPETVSFTKEQAKKVADSLCGLLKGKKAKFEDLVEKHSDDGGKKSPEVKKGEKANGSKGDYGWVNASSGFVEPFKNGGLDNKKGDLVVVESNFGYHIMEVLDSKGSQKKVQLATIEHKIEASSKTMQGIFLKASQFAGKNTTDALFQKAVVDENLNKRIADNIKETDKTIAGIESPRPLVRWAYEHNKGDVSEPMEFGNKFIVSSLVDVKEKGIAPMDQVADDVKAKAIKEKKAEMLIADFDSKANGATTIEAVAEKMKLSITDAPNVNFNANFIPNVGNEAFVIGYSTAMKAKALSKPLKGTDGVYVVYVDAVVAAPAVADYKTQQNTLKTQLQGRVDFDVYDALKANANIVDKLIKFY